MSFPRPHQRVKWISMYDHKTVFKGTVVSVIDDRAVVSGDIDNKYLTLPTYRLSVIDATVGYHGGGAA